MENKLNLGPNPFEDVAEKKYVSSKVRKAQRVWSIMGLFVICLVISMPFYSANVMATSLSITTNSGNGGIDGFLDAESDTWNLAVEITNLEEDDEVLPEQVFLELGESQLEFSSCSGDSLSTHCEYQSVLESGVSEGSYSFRVVYYDLMQDPNDENSTELGAELASDTDSIYSDGSEPSITINDIYQDGEEIYLDFSVEDDPSDCVGLDTVEIIDSDSGSVLQTIELGILEDCSFDYIDDADLSGVLETGLSGEGDRHIKIRATDLLGHTETSSAKTVETDFISPNIETGSLALIDFADYIGEYAQSTDVSINITECGDLEEVDATSDYIEFHSQDADCDLVDSENCLWECSWNDLTVYPSGSSVSATINAIDEQGNEASASVSASFNVDSTGPSVNYLGTAFQYNDNSYLAAGSVSSLFDDEITNKVFVYVSESQSGIESEDIILNLDSVGGSDYDSPDECYEAEEANYICVWTVNPGSSGSTTTEQVVMRYFEDVVGNSGDLITSEIIVDGVDPIVYSIELYGYSAIGEKGYFQSNDDVVIKMNVYDAAGLTVFVDVSDIVMDAENKYAYGYYEDTDGDGDEEYVESELDGWISFTEEDCERDDEARWECEFQIDSIKSGYDKSSIDIVVTDTAGNEADWGELLADSANVYSGSNGNYDIEIFALDEETQPDFWEVQSVTAVDDSFGAVDLDIAELYNSQIMMSVGFESDINNVEAAFIELKSCEPESDAPALSRSILINGIMAEPDSDPESDIILELEPFDPGSVVDFSEITDEDFTTVEMNYICTFDIYSIVEDTAMNYAESQEVIVPVSFGYTEKGALDENVESYVYELTHTKTFQFLDSIKVLGKIMQWVRYLMPIITMLMGFITLFSTISGGMDSIRTTGPGYAAATTFCGVKGFTTGDNVGGLYDVLKKISPFVEIFTCNPGRGADGEFNTGWYGQYQSAVLNVFNTFKALNIKGGVASTSLYDNIWTSSVGLCIPGIIYNLEKLRQIYCQQAGCLLNEVPSGINTVRGCQLEFDLLTCKYFWGELLATFNPLSNFGDFISNVVTAALTNPFGWISGIVSLMCTIGLCATAPTGGNWANICNVIGIGFMFIDAAENIFGMIKSYPSVSYDLCKELDVDRHYGEVEESAESVTTDVIADSESSDESGSDEE